MSPHPEEGPHENQETEDDGSWIDEGLLKNVLKQEATILHINVERATGKGDNYLSVIYRVRVQYRLQESDDVHVKGVIIKSLPHAEYMLELIEELNIFRREIAIYRDVLPTLYAFADTRLHDDSFKRFSAEYHQTDRADVLILDDLKPKGFVMASRKDRLDFAHAKLVVHSLARLHALSIAYTEKNPDFLIPFEEFMYCESNRERLDQFILPTLRDMTEEVKKWEGFDKIGNKLERLRETFMEKFLDASKSNGFQNVLLHGDSWVNNLLYKYSETREPVDLRFVDFQIARKNSPALDLQYFLYSSLQNEVLFVHYDDLLQEYYNELRCSAKDLGYKGDLFTLEELCQEMNRTAPFGFYAAVSILAVVLADPHDVTDMDKITVNNGEVQIFGKVYESPEFRKAFETLLLNFDERGVLD